MEGPLRKENIRATVDMLDWTNKKVGLTIDCSDDRVFNFLNLSGRKVTLTIALEDGDE